MAAYDDTELQQHGGRTFRVAVRDEPFVFPDGSVWETHHTWSDNTGRLDGRMTRADGTVESFDIQMLHDAELCCTNAHDKEAKREWEAGGVYVHREADGAPDAVRVAVPYAPVMSYETVTETLRRYYGTKPVARPRNLLS